MSETEATSLSSIVWNSDEFIAALQIMINASRMSPEEQDTWIQEQFGAQGPTYLQILSSKPFPSLYVNIWLQDRYQAHAPAISFHHFRRLLAIEQFLRDYSDQLEDDNWQNQDNTTLSYDYTLIRALVSIHFTLPEASDSETGIPNFRYEDVVNLATNFFFERVTVTEFQPTIFRNPGDGLYQIGYEPIELSLLQQALAQLKDIQSIGDTEVSAIAQRVHIRFPETFQDGYSDEQLAVAHWFIENKNIDPETAINYTNRVLTYAQFLFTHKDRLAHYGLSNDYDDFLSVNSTVLFALSLINIKMPKGSKQFPPLDYGYITKIARNLEARDVEVQPDRVDSATTLTINPNDPCPCGSSKNYESCHGSHLH